jgi:hypothetical protein
MTMGVIGPPSYRGAEKFVPCDVHHQMTWKQGRLNTENEFILFLIWIFRWLTELIGKEFQQIFVL